MTDRIAVGTPVTVSASSDNYLSGYGMSRDDLVVLAHIGQHYGLGPSKNMGGPAHSRDGWIYFSDSQVTAKPQESKVTQFKAGDKVEFIEDYPAGPAKTGDRATVQWVDDGIAYFEEAIEGALYSRLKLTEEPAALKVGDKVVVEKDFPTYTWHNTEGVITTVGNTYYRVKVTKAGPNNAKYVEVGKEYTLSGLTLLPPFTFKDIRVGDTIRRTATYKGATEVREGVVGTKGSYYFANEQGNYILAYDTDGRGSITDVTLELLNRPEPEPEPVKEAWETAKTGDHLITVDKDGCKRIHTKQDDGFWKTLIVNRMADGKAQTGYTRSNTTLKNFIEDYAVGAPEFVKA